MKKVSFLFVFVFLVSTFIMSQTPQYYNYNTTNSGNTFPLGTASGRMVQWLALAGDMNQPGAAPSGNITKIYLMVATNFGPITYTNLSILFGQATITALPTSAFYTGSRDTVYKRASVSLTGIATQWLEFALDHPFAYDNTKSLIVQLEQLGATGSALYSLGNTYLTGKRRTYSTSPPPFSVQGQDAYVYNFGVDITPVSGINITSNNLIPKEYNLEQNYPNPFNPMTKINFDLPKSGMVSIKIYDILGKEIKTILNEVKNPGSYSIELDCSAFLSGVYFYKIETGGFISTKKMILIK
jgi:hypothetical protein